MIKGVNGSNQFSVGWSIGVVDDANQCFVHA